MKFKTKTTGKRKGSGVTVSRPARVWVEIELPPPSPERDQIGHERAAQLCLMLRRLGHQMPGGKEVWWHPGEGRYCFRLDSGGTYVEAGDNGHWFSLEFFAGALNPEGEPVE